MAKKATVMAVVNQKGGTGKTTTTENLGVGLAMEGKKVLVVDTDPQASLTISLGNPVPDELPTTLSDMMAKVMMEKPIEPGEGILHHPEGIDLMPSNIELSGLEVSLVNAMSRETILRQYLDIEPFMAPKFEDNIILTKTERLMMSNRPKNPANARNKNVLIIGGSGSGKTRFWLKPNLLQMHSSYVVTDPKGSIVIECGNALLKNGYNIKIFNTINFKKSMHYNPFAYIHSEKDILKLVTTLIANTKGDGKAGDEFWTKAETLLYCALIGYIHYEAPVEEQNFSTLIEFLNAMEVREDDEEFQNPVDLMFEALEKKKPNHFAVRQYKKYKLAAGVVCFRRLLNQSIGKSPKTYNLHNHERSASYEKKRENHCSLRAFEP